MTDLLSPVLARRAASGPPARRPLALGAAIAGLVAPALLLLGAWGVALVGWFASDGGSYGTTRDALRVGADAWLLAHGTPLVTDHATITALPLGLTLIAAVVTWRCGRWAGSTGASEGPRGVAMGAVVLAGVYGAVALVVALLAAVPGAQPSLGRAFVGGALLAAFAGGTGLAAGAGELAALRARLPRHARSALLGAVFAGLLMIAAGALLAAGMLALHYDAAANVLARLHPDTADGLLSVLLLAAVAPNVTLLAAAYLLGPGFAVGTGTVVAPAQVVLGPLPAVPVLAALPASGAGPSWGWAVPLVPGLVGVASALLAARCEPTRSYEIGAARGLGAGLLGAVLVTGLVGLAGGAIGPGRMADLGAPVWEVLGTAAVALGSGGIVGGAASAWWRRRTVAEEDEVDLDADEATVRLDLSREETVRIPRPRTD